MKHFLDATVLAQKSKQKQVFSWTKRRLGAYAFEVCNNVQESLYNYLFLLNTFLSTQNVEFNDVSDNTNKNTKEFTKTSQRQNLEKGIAFVYL